jgi:AsmA protein
MRKLFIGLGIVVVLLVATALILPSLIPASVYKDKITEQVSSGLGRDVQIAGDVKLSVFPTLMAKANLVTIANAEGFSDQAFATMDSLEAKVKLWPLFKKQVEINAFTLVNPIISLEKTKTGKVNWTFGDESAVPSKQSEGAFARDGRYTDLQINLGEFSLENGSINYRDASSGTNYDVREVNMKLSMPGLDKPIGVKGDMIANDMPIDLELKLETPKAFLNGETAPVILKLKSDLITVSANGRFTPSSKITFDMDFDADIPSTPKLIAFLKQDNPYSALTETTSIKGNVVYDGIVDVLVFDDLDFKTKGNDLSANYVGQIKLGKDISFNGRFDAASPSLKRLAATGNIDLPYVEALGAFKASGTLNGSAKSLEVSNVEAALTDGMLNMDFKGNVISGKNLNYDGLVKLDIPSLRQLAAIGGTTLAPNTSAGQVYGLVSVSGQAKGTLAKASFLGADIRFDDLVGIGDFNANLTDKPYISGKLDMQGLDIRPYQAAMYANRPKGVQPWSNEPLNLSFLNLFDAAFTLNTPSIIMSSMEMGQSTIKTSVKNGVLNTNIPNVSLYGGKGTLDMKLNASIAVPQVALDFTLNNVDGQGLLGAVANFTKLSGNTGTTMRIKGAGRSQAEIMRSLSGDGNFELAEGIVTGVDIEQFTSNFNSIDAILQTRALPAGIGPSYNTPFNKIAGLFTIKNGVVTVGDFALNANNVLAEGAGTLDLGKQRVDFSLRPRMKGGKGLAGFGIPIKLSGDFGGIKAGLDSDLMTKIVAARAKAELQNQLTNQVGGDIGSIIGGLLGDQNPDTKPKSKNPKKEEDKNKEDPLEKILGNLFGGD